MPDASTASSPDTPQIFRRAAVRATLAPSIGNSQPWRFLLGPDFVEVHPDLDRRLVDFDRLGRQLAISCGCALFNIRVSLAHSECGASVRRRGDSVPLVALARAESDIDVAVPSGIALLDGQIDDRKSAVGPFANSRLPADVVSDLTSAAAAEGAYLAPVVPTDNRGTVFVLAVLGDGPRSWLQAGEALERVLLRCTLLGYRARPDSSLIENRLSRDSLQGAAGEWAYPQVSLRIGHAQGGPGTRRRRLVDVLDQNS